MSTPELHTGQRFGRLTLIARTKFNRKTRRILWRCRCDCDRVVVCTNDHLRRGSALSCGCLKAEKNKRGAYNAAGRRPSRRNQPAIVTISGQPEPLTAACARFEISAVVVYNRIKVLGWSEHDAFHTPVGRRGIRRPKPLDGLGESRVE